MPTVNEWTGKYRLRVKRDSDGTEIVSGAHGHIYEHNGDGQFGLVLEDNAPAKPSKAKSLLGRRRRGLAAGFTAHQSGDCESTLLFDPTNPEQSRLAIALVGARRRRVLDPEHRQKLLTVSQRTKFPGVRTVLNAPSAV